MAELFDISPEISEETAVWPGDVPFFCDTDSVTTTLHVGAHADAPLHLSGGAASAAEAPLAPYLGPCQLMAVDAPRGGRVQPRDLPEPVRAGRLLLRTGTAPPTDEFRTDFAGLSAELVEHLDDCGVVLVGVDTPSVDPYGDPDLVAHRACGRLSIAVLEGLRLDRAPPGLYTLVALPLRIRGADASPVRAVLVRGSLD